MSRLNLSDVNLPAEDADKPADVDFTSPEGDEGIVDEGVVEASMATLPEENKEDAKPIEDSNKQTDTSKNESGKESTADSKPAEDAKPVDEVKPKDDAGGFPSVDDSKKEELTAFHEHPDWKKMQDKVENLTKQLEEATKAKGVTEEAAETATKNAVEKTNEEIARLKKEGWDPKSVEEYSKKQLEIYAKYSQEEMLTAIEDRKKKEDQVAQSATDEKTAFLDNANTAFKAEGVTELKEKEAVAAKLKEWTDSGIVSPNSKNIEKIISTIVDNLKTAGTIGKSPASIENPQITTEEKTKQDAVAKEKNDTNSIISTGGSEGESIDPQKKSYKDLHGSSLSSIVAKHNL